VALPAMTGQPPARRTTKSEAAVSALSGLQNVDVQVTVEWGRTELTVAEALGLGPNAMLRTSQAVTEPVEVRVNGRLFGRGKLVLVGGNYAVQLTELVGG
jgi:flagellar motor switch protein FliN/FliY